jgi:hypothetical protein
MVSVARPTGAIGVRFMSRFYLLPPRAELGERIASFLRLLFPGLDWDAGMRLNLAEALGEAAECQEGVIVVFRDDLPAGETVSRALVDGFGAEAGDEVIEVRPAGRGADLVSRRFAIAA